MIWKKKGQSWNKEWKETRSLLDTKKDENFVLTNKVIEVQKELEYAKIMKMELEALSKTNVQASSADIAMIAESKQLIEKDNQILKLQLKIKEYEAQIKDINEDCNHRVNEIESDFKLQKTNLEKVIRELEKEKDGLYDSHMEQEKLMTSALANFYFDNLKKQQIQQQSQRGQSSFLSKLRGASYRLSSD